MALVLTIGLALAIGLALVLIQGQVAVFMYI